MCAAGNRFLQVITFLLRINPLVFVTDTGGKVGHHVKHINGLSKRESDHLLQVYYTPVNFTCIRCQRVLTPVTGICEPYYYQPRPPSAL